MIYVAEGNNIPMVLYLANIPTMSCKVKVCATYVANNIEVQRGVITFFVK